MAASALYGASGFGNWARLAAQQALTQDQLLEFETYGNVSLIHVTDIHAQMKPIFFREPEVNIGVGVTNGHVPHITGADFRKLYGIADGSPSAYALSYNDFTSLAQQYGRVGGLDRVATVVNSIRADNRLKLWLPLLSQGISIQFASRPALSVTMSYTSVSFLWSFGCTQ